MLKKIFLLGIKHPIKYDLDIKFNDISQNY